MRKAWRPFVRPKPLRFQGNTGVRSLFLEIVRNIIAQEIVDDLDVLSPLVRRSSS